MLTIQSLATFFGWCTVLNIAFYVLALIGITAMGHIAVSMNTAVFSVSEDMVRQVFFEVMTYWRLVILAFALIPYIALKIMSYN